jgi:uncharacterized membrane protein
LFVVAAFVTVWKLDHAKAESIVDATSKVSLWVSLLGLIVSVVVAGTTIAYAALTPR